MSKDAPGGGVDSQNRDALELARFLGNYGQDEAAAQDPSEAAFDSQLKSISLPLAQRIAATAAGTVLDIGCGRGVLLRRLAAIDAFATKPGWQYVGAEFEEHFTPLLTLAAELRLHKRVDVIALDELYRAWVSASAAPRPLSIVVRNVLHELNIQQTAVLVEALARNMTDGDHVVIQDLQVFPQAERGNACWHPEILVRMLADAGIDTIMVDEATPRGNRWFTLTGERHRGPRGVVRKLVAAARREQYGLWSRAERLVPDDTRGPGASIALLDLDLQLASLQRQLTTEEPGISTQGSARSADEIATLAIRAQIGTFDGGEISRSLVTPGRVAHFRDRANSQDALEEFLLGDATLALIRGGTLAGKSVLVAEVLARRAHDRQPVFIDVQGTSSVWNILEAYFAGIGVAFSYELIQDSRTLSLADVRADIKALIDRCARKTVVVFDHTERLLDPTGKIDDEEIREFIGLLALGQSSKVIITSRADLDLSCLPAGVLQAAPQPPVGRFPEGKHVENVLDDFVARDALGIVEYPPDLIEAIDRHPFLAMLAARVIQEEGKSATTDPAFIVLLRHKLRLDLLKRIGTEKSRSVVDWLARLRGPVPRAMLEDVAGSESVDEALRLGLLYFVFDRRRADLLAGLNVLRGSQDSTEESIDEAERDRIRGQHVRLADWYRRLYRETADARWVRERYFHALAAGDQQALLSLGVAYKSDVFAAGEYWFRERDYRSALWAFETACQLGVRSYQAQLRLASCLMRVGRRNEGEEHYSALLKSYPFAMGVKTSYIDSLLFLHKEDAALGALQEFGIKLGDDAWTDQEYGRSYLGLHRNREAVAAFRSQLSLEVEAITYVRLAQAYHRCGERAEVERTLRAGLRIAPQSRMLGVAYAAHLIRVGGDAELAAAEAQLKALEGRFPYDGGVLQQLCKLLGMTGRGREALEMIETRGRRIRPERYVKPMKADALIALGHYRGCVEELHSVPEDNEHLVGLKKKAFLWWARTEETEQSRRAIALRGLAVSFDERLWNNIPIVIMEARLAMIAGEPLRHDAAMERLRLLNPSVAASVSDQDVSFSYWDSLCEGL